MSSSVSLMVMRTDRRTCCAVEGLVIVRENSFAADLVPVEATGVVFAGDLLAWQSVKSAAKV